MLNKSNRIPLKGLYGDGKFTIVSDVDYEKIHNHTCYMDKRGYVYVKIGNNKYLLHRFIFDIHGKKTPMIDHKNRNRLDNRRENLRECTNSQNQANTKSWNGKEHKGIYLFRNRWVARIMKSGKRTFLGRFKNKQDAILVYNNESKRLFGEFSYSENHKNA